MSNSELSALSSKKSLPISSDKPWLAPLAGWSDLPFRLICREQGAAVACTEMVSAKGLVYGGKNTEELLDTNENDNSSKNPLVVQIFGAEWNFMERAIFLLQERGFRNFDINVGCSVAKVVKTGSGAAMLRDMENLFKVAKHVINQVHNPKYIEDFLTQKDLSNSSNLSTPSKPFDPTNKNGNIGFKIRLGYEMNKDVYLDVAKELEILGADWITLHPRYAKQAFSGVPDYQSLAKLKHTVKIPVIASGDLFSAEIAHRVIKETNVDTVMYARGAMANPFIFKEHKQLYENENTENLTNDLHKLILQHLKYAKKYKPKTALLQMRTIVPRYAKNLENAKSLRLALIASKSYEEINSALNNFFNSL